MDTTWRRQSNHDNARFFPGDDFWQENLWLGWRFAQRRAELAVGVLNLSDTDFRLYPLNDLTEPSRERTVVLSARFAF